MVLDWMDRRTGLVPHPGLSRQFKASIQILDPVQSENNNSINLAIIVQMFQGLYWKTDVIVDQLTRENDPAPFAGDNSAIYQRINLTSADQKFHRVLESEELDGLVLSETPELILVLVREGDITERIGIVESEEFLGPKIIQSVGKRVEAFPNPELHNVSKDRGQRTWCTTPLG